MERVVDIADAAVKHMEHVIQSSDMDETGAVLCKRRRQNSITLNICLKYDYYYYYLFFLTEKIISVLWKHNND